MKTIHLHGRLKKIFGGPFKWNIKTPEDAVRNMMVQFKGFRQEIVKGYYKVVIGNPKTGIQLSAEDLGFRLSDGSQLHFFPLPEGAGGDSKSVGKIVLGVALAAFALIAAPAAAPGLGTALATSGIFSGVTYGSLLFTGAALILTGVGGLVSPVPKAPKYSDRERPDQQASFIFQNGAINTSEQGQPVPLVFGRFLCGSVVISAGINIEQVKIT